VFTGLFDLKKPGEYPYLVIWRSGNDGGLRRGKPPAKLLRGEVGFEELPGEVRRKVLETYRKVWGLSDVPGDD
jgi:hypothetical protein